MLFLSSIGSQVAFYAREVVDHSDLGVHQTIVFKNAITNIGNDYHPITGLFICSQPGVYVFFLGIEVIPYKGLHTAIVKNGVDIAFNYAVSTGGGVNGYDKANTMTIIQLNVGDSVWVRVIGQIAMGPVLSDPENFFSGFLLY